MIILSHSNWPEGYVMVRKFVICRNDWKGKVLNVTDSLEFDSLVADHVAL